MIVFLKKRAALTRIEGREIDLVLVRALPADAEKQYVPSYEFSIVLHGTNTKVGGICLRLGDNCNTYYGGHIGYGIDESHRGHSFAAKACLLLQQVALDHGITELVITCNPDNYSSRRTCEKLGLKLKEIVDLPLDNEMYQEGERQKCRYIWHLS